MYSDSHEQEDMVEYRRKFVEWFKEYECHFHTWDDKGNELVQPSGFLVPGEIGCFCLILVTHDESTFYQNDQHQIYWGCPGQNVTPRPKGEDLTLMVSDFLTADWGPLCDNDRCVATGFFSSQSYSLLHSEAWIVFRAGKTRDSWFTADHLLAQVDDTINIFQECTKGHAQGLFLFDNTPSHRKHANDALSAHLMVKGALFSTLLIR